MAIAAGNLVGAKSFLMDFFASAGLTGTAGQLVVREATQTNVGEATNPSSTTSVTDVVGLLIDPTTSQTSPTREPGALLFATSGGNPALENIARVDCGPFCIMRFPISGGTTANTVLQPGTATPANILINTAADSSAPYATITAATVGTVDMTGGLIKGKTGNNGGAIRKMTVNTSATSATVGIGFVNAIAVGDQFIRVPVSRASTQITFTTDYAQVNGIAAFAAGASFRVVNVIIDEINNVAAVDLIAQLHIFNKNS